MKQHIFSSISEETLTQIIKLRFGDQNPLFAKLTYLSYRQIGKIFGFHINIIRKVCINPGNMPKQCKKHNKKVLNLTLDHLNCLVSNHTLKELKLYSIADRAKIFHRKFPYTKISTSTLRNIYLSNGVKYKNSKSSYRISESKKTQIQVAQLQSYPQICRAYLLQENIIYLDETIFKPHSVKLKSWAGPYQNQDVQNGGTNIKTLAALVLISGRLGLLGYVIKEKLIKIPDLIQGLEIVDNFYKGQQAILFMDNLKAHHNKFFKQQIEANGWSYIFNAPYSSEYNCIEEIFSRVKLQYKKDIIERNFNFSNKIHYQIVRNAIYNI